MPLSEEELRLLEQMERALVAEDPKLASTLRGTRRRRRARRHMALGIVIFVVGIGLLMSGAVLKIIPLGIVGFVVMLGSAYWTLTAWRGQSQATEVDPQHPSTGGTGLRVVEGGKTRRARPAKSPKSKQQGSMMERFEERWRRGRDQNGGGGY